jgi:hypothetical protein
VNPRLRGGDLPLDAGQEPPALGQGPKPKLARSVMSSGLAIRMTSVLC